VELELEIPLLRAVVEAEPVLEAGAPTALNRHAQDVHVVLLGQQLPDLRRRVRGQGHQRRGLDALGDLHAGMVATGTPVADTPKRVTL
jgi:hypothetical protein